LSDKAKNSAKIRQVSIAPVLGETIRRVNQEESVSEIMPVG